MQVFGNLKRVPVLDHGHVVLQGVMGSDDTIVAAARTSYGKGTRSVNENNTLIRYLLRHNHTSPFEMAEMKFHIRCPIYVWRQWVRHRTANVNEYSMRYSEAIDDVDLPGIEDWRLQDPNNKQGSDGVLDRFVGVGITNKYREAMNVAKDAYDHAIAAGVSREQARIVLPVATYTEVVWKIDVHNLMHFLTLRMKPNAQLEIRLFAQVIADMFALYFPVTYKAWIDYQLSAIKLTALEIACIANRDFHGEMIKNKREREEYLAKVHLLKLGE